MWRKKIMQRSFFPAYSYTQFLLLFSKIFTARNWVNRNPKCFHHIRSSSSWSSRVETSEWVNIMQAKHGIYSTKSAACLLLFIRYFRRLIVRRRKEWGTNHEYFIMKNFPLSWISIRENIHKENNPFNFSPLVSFFSSLSLSIKVNTLRQK